MTWIYYSSQVQFLNTVPRLCLCHLGEPRKDLGLCKSHLVRAARGGGNAEPWQRTVPAGLWRWGVFKAKIFEIQQVQLEPRRAWRVACASCWQFLG